MDGPGGPLSRGTVHIVIGAPKIRCPLYVRKLLCRYCTFAHGLHFAGGVEFLLTQSFLVFVVQASSVVPVYMIIMGPPGSILSISEWMLKVPQTNTALPLSPFHAPHCTQVYGGLRVQYNNFHLKH